MVIEYHITTSTNLPTNKFEVRVELWHRIYRIWKLSNHNVISSSGVPLPALAINPHFPPPSRFCVYACRSSVCIYMHICMHSFFCDFPYFVGWCSYTFGLTKFHHFPEAVRQAKDGKISLNLHGTWNCHKNMLKSDHQFGWFQDQALTRWKILL